MSSDSATRKPLPPPPPAALIATGYPIDLSMTLRAASTDFTGSVVPGTIGTPASFISSRARVFEPIASIASAGGPTNTMPASSQARAKAAFSARKPYPGWIASAPDCLAASRIFSTFR